MSEGRHGAPLTTNPPEVPGHAPGYGPDEFAPSTAPIEEMPVIDPFTPEETHGIMAHPPTAEEMPPDPFAPQQAQRAHAANAARGMSLGSVGGHQAPAGLSVRQEHRGLTVADPGTETGPQDPFTQQETQGIVRQHEAETTQEQPSPNGIRRRRETGGGDTPNRELPGEPGDLADLLRIQLVDESHGAVTGSADAAAEQLNREINDTSKGNAVSRFMRKIWKGNIAKDYYLNKYTQENRDTIVREQNIHALDGGDMAAHRRTSEAVVTRMAGDFIHDRAGETNKDLSSLTHGAQLEAGLKDLVLAFARGALDEDGLEVEKNRLLDGHKASLRGADRNKGLVVADNIIKIARHAKAAVDHDGGTERLEAALAASKIMHGEARMGARTQARMNAVERITDKVMNSRFGPMVNETTVGLAVSAVFVAAKLGRGTVGKAVTAVSTMGVFSAATAGLREAVHFQKDRATYEREDALGDERADLSGKVRKRMKEFSYNKVSCESMIADLDLVDDIDGDPSKLSELLNTITEAEMRIDIGDTQEKDLFRFDGKLSVEEQRTALDMKLATARVKLRRVLNGADDATLARLGVTTRDVNALVQSRVASVQEKITGDIDARDKAARNAKYKRVALMAGVGFVTGFTMGVVGQEAVAAISDHTQGVFEAISGNNSGEHQTLLAGVWDKFNGHPETVGTSGPGSHDAIVTLPDHTQVHANVPDGYSFKQVNGHWEMLDSKSHVVADNLGFNKDGSLNDATKNLLNGKGFHYQEVGSHTVHDPDTYKTHDVKMTTKEYIKNHPHDFKKVERKWLENDTPAPKFDKNELGIQWGGIDGTGIDRHGNYVLNVAHMTAGGSYEGNDHINVPEIIKAGKMKMEFSADNSTQKYVKWVAVDKQGNVHIAPRNDFVGENLFTKQDGRAHFIGGYAEAVDPDYVDANGVQHVKVVATVVGEHRVHHVVDHVREAVHHSHKEIDVKITAPEAPVDVLPPPVVPVLKRSALEYTDNRDPRAREQLVENDAENGYNGYYGGAYGQESKYWKEWSRERSPRLQENPNAQLNTGEELNWYRSEQRRLRGDEYISEIDANIEGDPTFMKIDDKIIAYDCIPVAAAAEQDNIYHTLRMISNMPQDQLDQTMIVLSVNWKKSLEGDPAEMANIQKTISEIERARADFPNVNIAAFQKVWSEEFVQEKDGKIYGEVIKTLYDTAALAVERAIRDGRRSPDTEAILITNDADTEGYARNYFGNYLRQFKENPEADVFSGTVRRGTYSYQLFPGYGVASDFYAILNMMSQRQQKAGNGSFTTEGPNSGIRMSMYAGSGGVEARVGAGADAVLGHRIRAARQEPAEQSRWQRLRRRPQQTVDPTRVMGKYVAGAQVDTLPDRLLGAYRQGKWIAQGWDNFDNGGYQERTAGMTHGTVDHENPATDMDAIAERIEVSVEGFASNWYRDPAVVASALTLTFGANNDQEPLYEYTWDMDKPGTGAFKFQFTDKGKKQLQARLLRDRKGASDPFGSRLNRQLYNMPSSGKPAPRAQARMIN